MAFSISISISISARIYSIFFMIDLDFDLTDDGTTPPLPELPHLWQETLAWQPDTIAQERFQAFYRCVRQGNRRVNLTRILEPEEFWEKHLWDSLRGVAPFFEELTGAEAGDLALPATPNVVDIGTGGGFPGIPVAIARPDWSVRLLDSTQKKVRFLQQAIAEVGLDNVRAIAGRAETLGTVRPYRDSCDLVLLRAVGAAEKCLDYAIPWLKPGGWAVLYRGRWQPEEAEALAADVEALGLEWVQTDRFETPQSQAVRHLLFLRRVDSGAD